MGEREQARDVWPKKHRAPPMPEPAAAAAVVAGQFAALAALAGLLQRRAAAGGGGAARDFYVTYLCGIYAVAFGVALQQNGALLGASGLLPWRVHHQVLLEHHGGSRLEAFWAHPSVLWLAELGPLAGAGDLPLHAVAALGLGLAVAQMLFGANGMAMLVLWALQLSLTKVGQSFYAFGWETQLAETGWLACFACPFWTTTRRAPGEIPPLVRWGSAWLLFRIMLGAGLIKVRGDACWRDLTCMQYHYETQVGGDAPHELPEVWQGTDAPTHQPVPNPLSRSFHASPAWFHAVETMANHIIELAAPWMLLLPRDYRVAGALLQIGFQATLICSGNLSFLNWLTVVPALALLDDRFFAAVFGGWTGKVPTGEDGEEDGGAGKGTGKNGSARAAGRRGRSGAVVHGAAALLVGYLSVPVVQNLLSSRQAMNTSFDRLALVNTYGAFGSVTKQRIEVQLEGRAADGTWHAYGHVCKPGDPARQSCLISPWHYRLDWLMWFLPFGPWTSNPWLVHLAAELLDGNEAVEALFWEAPAALGGEPPDAVRATQQRYEFAPPGAANVTRVTFPHKDGGYMPEMRRGDNLYASSRAMRGRKRARRRRRKSWEEFSFLFNSS